MVWHADFYRYEDAESLASITGDPHQTFFKIAVNFTLGDGKELIVGEITYMKHTQPMLLDIMTGSLAGVFLSMAIAFVLVFCAEDAMVRKICTELKWTKYYLRDKLRVLSLYMRRYAYLAPWLKNRDKKRKKPAGKFYLSLASDAAGATRPSKWFLETNSPLGTREVKTKWRATSDRASTVTTSRTISFPEVVEEDLFTTDLMTVLHDDSEDSTNWKESTIYCKCHRKET